MDEYAYLIGWEPTKHLRIALTDTGTHIQQRWVAARKPDELGQVEYDEEWRLLPVVDERTKT